MADDQHQHWNLLHQKNKADLKEPSDFAKEVLQLFNKQMNILELGCGSGTDSYFFAEHGHSVLGTDFSEIVVIRDQDSYHIPELSFQVVDISQKLPFDDSTFDCVYARLSLHYFSDLVTKKVFKEIYRILKPSGYLCFICKSTADPLFGKGNRLEENVFENKGHIRHFFSEKYAKKCLKGLFEIKILTNGEEKFYGDQSAFIKVIAQKIE